MATYVLDEKPLGQMTRVFLLICHLYQDLVLVLLLLEVYPRW